MAAIRSERDESKAGALDEEDREGEDADNADAAGEQTITSPAL
jgi:hypothetical protein